MQLTVKDVFDINQGLMDLAEKELPIGVAFNIQLTHRKITEEVKTAENLRNKIVQKYKEKDLKNGRVQLKEDKLDEFNKEMDELMKQKVNVNINKIKIHDLESITVAPKTLGLIHTILEDGEENDWKHGN